MGAKVDVVTAYRTVRSDRNASELLPLFDGGKVDVITFTSPSTVTHFLGIMGPGFRLPSRVRIACIGPVTAEAARKAGLTVDILQERYTIPELVDAIAAHFAKEGADDRSVLPYQKKPVCPNYYSGNNICQSRHSRESGNPKPHWMPDQVRHDN